MVSSGLADPDCDAVHRASRGRKAAVRCQRFASYPAGRWRARVQGGGSRRRIGGTPIRLVSNEDPGQQSHLYYARRREKIPAVFHRLITGRRQGRHSSLIGRARRRSRHRGLRASACGRKARWTLRCPRHAMRKPATNQIRSRQGAATGRRRHKAGKSDFKPSRAASTVTRPPAIGWIRIATTDGLTCATDAVSQSPNPPLCLVIPVGAAVARPPRESRGRNRR